MKLFNSKSKKVTIKIGEVMLNNAKLIDLVKSIREVSYAEAIAIVKRTQN